MIIGGDSFLSSKTSPGTAWPLFGAVLFSSSYYGDGYIYNEFLRNPIISEWPDKDRIFEFLWRDPNLKPRSPNDLPLSRYFGFPFGWMIARTGWGDESVIAEMKVNIYHFANHKHLDAGNFQIYYKGSLVIDSGLYRGYGSPHDLNYYKRTIAHNTLLIYNPDEPFSWWGSKSSNDGGQRIPNRGSEPGTLEVLLDVDNNYKTGEVLGQGFGPDFMDPEYTYLKGDITEAYSDKVKEVKRTFVFLNMKMKKIPAVLIVFDKVVSSNPDFKKYWLLHCIDKPVVSGNEVVVTGTERGERGKLVNTTLLPELENVDITPVGGPGMEFWVFGNNYPLSSRPGRNEESDDRGAWRIELSPKRGETTNYFLNVMQVMDQTVSKVLDAELVKSEDVSGVRIADRIVMFSKTSERTNKQVSFSIEEGGMFKYLVTDLAEGTWQVMRNGDIFIPAIPVTSKEGTIYFKGPEGRYSLLR
jgi:heparin/heparan-sulfate lyase